jgi:GNAT superfamily N-acetyltransferase/tetratricopeptide (TPR) repeat protein
VTEIAGRQLRPVVDSDSAALIELIGTTWAEYPGVILDVDNEEPWLRAPARYYAEHGGSFWLATGADGALHACIGVRPLENDAVELKSLYVAAAGRRGGLGSGLVRFVEDEAARFGARRIVLWSDRRFSDAHRLYSRLGYWRTGQSRELHDLSTTTEYGFAKDVLSAQFDFADLPASIDRFSALAAQHPGTRFGSIASTQQARALGLSGDWDSARARLATVDVADSVVAGWVAIERGRIANSSGEDGRGRAEFEEAFAAGRDHGEDGLAVDAAHMIGIVGSPSELISWGERALALADASADPRAKAMVGPLLNNLGVSLGEQDRWDEALAVHARSVVWWAERGAPGPLAIARWQQARSLRAVHRVEEALAIQLDLDADSDPYVAEERGECLYLLERFDESRPYFAQAAKAFAADEWFVANEAARLERLRQLAEGSSSSSR